MSQPQMKYMTMSQSKRRLIMPLQKCSTSELLFRSTHPYCNTQHITRGCLMCYVKRQVGVGRGGCAGRRRVSCVAAARGALKRILPERELNLLFVSVLN